MLIDKNTVVTLDYRVWDPDGSPIDDGAAPLVYLHGGYAGIFPLVEEALEGKGVGDEVKLKLQPEDAFGEYDESQVRVEPLAMFPEDIEVGMQFERMTDDGEDEVLYTITDIADGKVVVDGNHPLAGTAIVFSCTVQDVRTASPEEITHGHAHGPDGHHHH
jgi:FKBP-type peptidyl-prolyl cis-trans isomerase SlyD